MRGEDATMRCGWMMLQIPTHSMGNRQGRHKSTPGNHGWAGGWVCGWVGGWVPCYARAACSGVPGLPDDRDAAVLHPRQQPAQSPVRQSPAQASARAPLPALEAAPEHPSALHGAVRLAGQMRQLPDSYITNVHSAGWI